jgi:hypothetical protein
MDMGVARERKKSGELDKTINRRKRFVELCKKLTRYSDEEIQSLLKNRIYSRGW